MVCRAFVTLWAKRYASPVFLATIIYAVHFNHPTFKGLGTDDFTNPSHASLTMYGINSSTSLPNWFSEFRWNRVHLFSIG